MCGIAGIFRLAAGAPPLDAAEMARVSAALARRGPDGQGQWRSPSGRLALAHRRLAVLDPSPAGAQPMTTADGRFTLVYNGEIYDYRERREELARAGVALRSASDTEVVLERLARDGVRSLTGLRGMFALALWDEVAGELLLARDFYGIKPLYYSVHGGVLRFASQVRALEAGGGVPLDVDPAGVAGFLAWGAVPEPLTIRRSIRALPAGHVLRASAERGVRLEALPCEPGADLPGELAAAVEASVAAHLVSDVPVAVFLSAGLDSALVAALARRHLPEPPVALTLTWREARGTAADEEPLARETARALGLRHVVREIAGEEIREALPEILAAMDQPSIDGFNTWLVARLARQEGFKVALSGLGGDELLGGYPSFADVPRWRRTARRLARVPALERFWPALVARLLPERPKLAGLLRHGRSLAGAYFLRRGLFLPEQLEGPLAGTYDPVLDAWERLGEGILGSTSGLLLDPWRAVHRLESTMYLRNQLLRDADWAGMAHGVEIRVPLVDARLRAAAAAAGFEPAKRGGKRSLIGKAAPELPAALFARPKSGFQLPIAEWLEARGGESAARGESARRTQGAASRRLARRVLAEFGVPWPGGA